jgi:hypothetical protein
VYCAAIAAAAVQDKTLAALTEDPQVASVNSNSKHPIALQLVQQQALHTLVKQSYSLTKLINGLPLPWNTAQYWS